MLTYKNYNIQIKGRVRDVGFRDLVENIARSLNLRGMVYNDIGGTVKIVCSGGVSAVKDMIKELKAKCANVGATIDVINQEEIPARVDLPQHFFKAPTDEFSDFGRKLDVGIDELNSINSKLDKLDPMDGKLDKLDTLVEGQDRTIVKTDTLVRGQEKMIEVLERIAEK